MKRLKAENDRQIKELQERRKRMAKKMFGAYLCLLSQFNSGRSCNAVNGLPAFCLLSSS